MKTLVNDVINTEAAILELPSDEQNSIRVLVNDKLTRNVVPKIKQTVNHNKNKDHSTAKNIKEKLDEKRAILTKADKGNTTVIMYESDYDKKINQFIAENNIDEVKNDPTPRYHKEINSCINKSKYLLCDKTKKQLKVTAPYAPKFKGLPKVHKPSIPIRPLVNYTSAPAYKIAKKIDKIIRANINLNPSYSLSNSLELCMKLNEVPIQSSHTLMSLDVENMYTNIPVNESIIILREQLVKNNTLNGNQIDELINLAKITVKQNYFQYKGKYYIQKEGLAMGSPLSSILAELFLNDFEVKHIMTDSSKYKEKIMFYQRYADDAICVFKGNARQIDIFTNYLNNKHPNIIFKNEIEQDMKLNYLDLTISRNNNKISYSIYHKPTQSSQVIHSTSHHPISHKMAAFHSFVHRLNSIPMNSDNYQKELNIIKFIASDNGYDPKIVDRIIDKKKNAQITNNRSNKYVTVTFGSQLCHKFSNILKKRNYKVAYKTTNKIENILSKRSSDKDKFNSAGVYKITCGDCPKFYIGQTRRSFKTRFNEHLPKCTAIQKSNYAEHLVNNNHNYSKIDENLKIIHSCNNRSKTTALENFEIYKAVKSDAKNVLNDKINSQANELFDTIIRLDKGKKQLTTGDVTSTFDGTPVAAGSM